MNYFMVKPKRLATKAILPIGFDFYAPIFVQGKKGGFLIFEN